MKLYKFILFSLFTIVCGFHVKSQDSLNLISTFNSEQQKKGSSLDFFQTQREKLVELSSVPYNPMSDTIYALEMRVFPEMRYILMYWSNKFCYTATHACSENPLTVYSKRIYPRIQMSMVEKWDTASLVKLSSANKVTQSNTVHASRIVFFQGNVYYDHFVFDYFHIPDSIDQWDLYELWMNDY